MRIRTCDAPAEHSESRWPGNRAKAPAPARKDDCGGGSGEPSFSALGAAAQLGTAHQGLPCHPLYSMRRPSAAGLEPGGLIEDAHTLRLADLTRPQLERIMPGVKLRGRIMPAWKKRHAKAPEPKDREVCQLIRAQRLVCRMSQTELANALGVTFQQVQKYEKGVNRVGARRLAKIAHTLKS